MFSKGVKAEILKIPGHGMQTLHLQELLPKVPRPFIRIVGAAVYLL